MIHVLQFTLPTDTVDYLDWIAKQLSEQRKTPQTRSDVVHYLAQRHWIKTQKRMADKKHKAKVQSLGKT